MLESKMMNQVRMLVPPTQPDHLTTKKYVDDLVEGLRWNPVKAAATGNVSGDATATTLTGAANGAFPSLDGVAILENDRVLLGFQSDKSQNGIYFLSRQGDAGQPWVLTRSTDADTGDEFRPNKAVYVMPDGVQYGDTTFKQTTGTSITLGTTAIEFALEVSDAPVLKAFDMVGNGSTTEFTFTHSIGTKDVIVSVRDEDGVAAHFATQAVSLAAVKVISGVAIPSGEAYRVVVVGKAD